MPWPMERSLARICSAAEPAFAVQQQQYACIQRLQNDTALHYVYVVEESVLYARTLYLESRRGKVMIDPTRSGPNSQRASICI